MKKKGFWLIALMSVFTGFIMGVVNHLLGFRLVGEAMYFTVLILLTLGIPIVYLLVINYTRQTGKLARLAEAVIAFAIYFFTMAFAYAITTVSNIF